MWHTQYADIIYICVCVWYIYIYTRKYGRAPHRLQIPPGHEKYWQMHWKCYTICSLLYQSDVQGSGPITPSPRPCLLELTNSSNMSFGDHAMQLMGRWKVSQLEAPRMRLCKALACATLLLVAVLHCPRLATGAGGQDRLWFNGKESTTFHPERPLLGTQPHPGLPQILQIHFK